MDHAKLKTSIDGAIGQISLRLAEEKGDAKLDGLIVLGLSLLGELLLDIKRIADAADRSTGHG